MICQYDLGEIFFNTPLMATKMEMILWFTYTNSQTTVVCAPILLFKINIFINTPLSFAFFPKLIIEKISHETYDRKSEKINQKVT